MENKKIGNFQAIALILIIIVNHLLLETPKNLIAQTGTGTILNMIYVFFLSIIFVFILVKLFNNFKGKDILDVSEFLGGKILKVIVGIIFIVYFSLILSTTIRVIVQNLQIIYFDNLHICLLTLIILSTIAIVYKFGSSTVIRCNSIIAPIAAVAILIISFSNISDFSLDRIYPILGFGAKELFITGASNIFAYSGLAILFFIMPMLKDTNDYKKIAFTANITIGILIVASITSIVLSFPFIDRTSNISSLYMESRDISYWQSSQRIDGIFVFSWILALLSYISVALFFIVTIFRKLTHAKKEFPVVLAFINIIYGVTLIPKSIETVRFLEEVVFKYANISLIIVTGLILMILANIKYYFQNSKHKKEVSINNAQ